MYLRDDPANPQHMSENERLDEVASILARGLLRLHRRTWPHVSDEKNLSESSKPCLDLSASLSPHRTTG
jgi:hypothetical protein